MRPVSHARTFWLVVGLAGLLVACQGPPAGPKAVPPDLLAPAREAMERGDYARGATLLRQLLASNPNNFEAHYRLGVSATYLDARDEAIREFKWVIAHGPADSVEVQTARTWLIRAGVLVEPRAPIEVASSSPPPANKTPAQKPDLASISGTVTGDEGGAVKLLGRHQLFLKGVPDSPTQSQFYVLRSDQQGWYRFTNVVPGEYMLTNRIAGQPVWRLKVTVEPGQQLVLNLTPDNSTRTRDDFPQAR